MRDSLAVDKWMLLALAALLAIGMTMVLSTSYLYSQERYGDGTYFFRKQLIAMGAGLIALIACSIVPSTLYRRFAYPLLALSFIVLALVLIPGIGVSRGGARRWLMLPGFAFQPSQGGGAAPSRGGSKTIDGKQILRNPSAQDLGQYASAIANGTVKVEYDA